MEPLKPISPEEEAEFRVMTTEMFKKGGALNVLDCVLTMQRVQIVILKKLQELLDEKTQK